MINKFNITFLLLWISLPSLALETEVEKWFDTAKQIEEKLEDLCPPKSCLLIGVGRSPSAIIAIAQVRHPHYAFNLPLSKFHYGFVFESSYTSLSAKDKKILQNHLELYLPSLQEIESKEILIVDFTVSGASLKSANQALAEFYAAAAQKNHRQAPVLKTFTITRVDHEEQCACFYFDDCVLLDEDDFFGNALAKQSFDSFSEYGQFELRKAPQTLIKQPSSFVYTSLKETLKSRLQKRAKKKVHALEYHNQNELLQRHTPYHDLPDEDRALIAQHAHCLSESDRRLYTPLLLQDPLALIRNILAKQTGLYPAPERRALLTRIFQDEGITPITLATEFLVMPKSEQRKFVHFLLDSKHHSLQKFAYKFVASDLQEQPRAMLLQLALRYDAIEIPTPLAIACMSYPHTNSGYQKICNKGIQRQLRGLLGMTAAQLSAFGAWLQQEHEATSYSPQRLQQLAAQFKAR